MSTAAHRAPRNHILARAYRLFWNKRFGLLLILAMTVLALTGALFAQVPAETRGDPQAYSQFLDSIHPKYRGWTTPLSALGLFHVFSSWPWRIVTVLLTLSIIACTTHRLPTLWRNATAPHTHVNEGFFDHARTHQQGQLEISGPEAVQRTEAWLRARRFRVIHDDRADGLNLYADRFRFAPLGTALAHAAFVLILLGVLVTNNTGFHDDEFTLPVGMGPVQVGHGTGLSMEARTFTDSYHADGRPMDYAADVVLYKDGKQVATRTLRVNSPLTYDGVAFHQSYFGFAAEVSVTNSQGRQIDHLAVPLQYQTDDQTQVYGKSDIAGTDLQLFVIAPASGQTDARIGPGQVQVELYQGNSTDPLAQQVITQGRATQVDGLGITFDRERQFTGLQVRKDNGAPLVWTGSLLLVLGMVATMFFRHQRLWIRVHPQGDCSQVRVASPDRHDSIFERKVAELVANLEPVEPVDLVLDEPGTTPQPVLHTTSRSTDA